MILEVKNVTKLYRNGAGIHNISFSIDKHGCYGILGVNGAGKSTLMNVITGYISCGTNNTVPNGAGILVPQHPKKI